MTQEASEAPTNPLARLVSLNITKAHAKAALIAFGEQAGLTVLIRQDARDTSVDGLVGTFQVGEALRRMLDGSGLEYRTHGDSIVVRKRSAADVASHWRTSDLRQNRSGSDSRNDGRFLRRLATALATTFLVGPVGATESEDADGKPKADATEAEEAPSDQSTDNPDDIETMVVTGTRLVVDEPTMRIDSITSEEMSARGLVTVEDIVRSIPHNVGSVTSQNNRWLRNSSIDDQVEGWVGRSTANLRGLGTKNTLVLVNGRRLAGAPGDENFAANLRDVPTEAIERVEVMMDSGSVLYGSDAIGGVINIITRKDYSGIVVSAQTHLGSTGSSREEYRMNLGRSWRSGSLSLAASKGTSVPLSPWRAGYKTRNLAPWFDGNPAYDFRSRTDINTPAISLSRWGGPYQTVDGDNDGRNLTVDDLRPVEEGDIVPLVPPDGSESTNDHSATLDFRQTLFDKATLSLEYIHNRDWSRADFEVSSRQLTIPASNAFNPFDRTVYVRYRPNVEVESGLIDIPNIDREASSHRAFAGLKYAVTELTDFTITYQTSWSESDGNHWTFYNNSSDPDRKAKMNEALASDDPDMALNVFGNGTAQNDTIEYFFNSFSNYAPNAGLDNYEWFLRTNAGEFDRGDIPILIGGERRVQTVRSSSTLQFSGLLEPREALHAWFAESTLTLVDEHNARPGINRLVLSLKGRYDRYDARGLDQRDEGEPVQTRRSYSHFTPRVGVRWDVGDTFSWRGSWGQSFRAPNADELALGRGVLRFRRPWDPLCGFCAHPDAESVYDTNPDLQPEYSTNVNLAINWKPSRLPGLDIWVDYRTVDYRDKITDSFALANLLPTEVYANLDAIFVRDEEGVLLQLNRFPINISRRYQQMIDLEVSQQIPIAPGAGTLAARLYGTYMLKYFQQAFEDSEEVDVTGTYRGMDRYSLFGEILWRKDNIGATLLIDYTPGYFNNWWRGRSWEPDRYHVGSRTTVDLSASYEMTNGLQFHFGAKNIFNRSFPFALGLGGVPYDTSRVDLRGRVVFFEASYRLYRD